MRRLIVLALCFWGQSVAAHTVAAQEKSPQKSVTLDMLQSRMMDVVSSHPRLLVNSDELQLLRQSLGQTGSIRDELAKAVIRHASLISEIPPIERELQGRRLLGQSRRCLERILYLSMAYQLTRDTKFVERGKREMLAVAEFTDWNPSHYLDVAEMTLAMALGYDWMFDALDVETRQTIRDAIKNKAVSLPFETEHNRWVRASNNWGQVCHCGMTAGALAILEDEPELAAKTVLSAVQNVPRSMQAFSPHGSYPEGPGYWSYGTSFNVILLELLDSVLGSDFGLSNMSGFDQTGQYLPLMTGPSGQAFNYADGGASRHPEAALYWFSKRFNRPDWLLGEESRLSSELSAMATMTAKDAGSGRNRLLPLALLWMSDQTVKLDATNIQMPLSWQSESDTPVAVHRSSWNPDAIFVGLKAGSPSAPHGQMDIGSFVLDADGVRWALDLGAEGYHGIESRGMNLWSAAQDSDRWTIFRQSNAGHNTLVIDGKLQVAKSHAKIVEFSSNPKLRYSVADMSTVYAGQAEKVQRRVELLPSREVVIQDELAGLAPGSRVRWAMITPGEVVSHTPSELRLKQQDQRLLLTIVEPAGASWSIINTEKPPHEWDSANPGTRMVAFEVEAPTSGQLKIHVIARPGSDRAIRLPNEQ